MNTIFRLTGRKHYKKFIRGVVISIILITTPFLFYAYRFAPKSESWDLGFMVLESGGFPTIKTFFHNLGTKLMFLVITSIWFFTAHQWWKYAILIPFSMFFFQLIGSLNHLILYTDNFEFLTCIPILLPILLIMIYFSKKIRKTSMLLDIHDFAYDQKHRAKEKLNKIKESKKSA